MPYRRKSGGFELSRPLGHTSIVNNSFVQDRLRSFRVYRQSGREGKAVPTHLQHHADDFQTPDANVEYLLAFDGSPNEVAVDEDYPSTQIGYMQIAGVLVFLEALLSENRKPLVDPRAVRDATQEALFPLVLPGSNVCTSGYSTVRDSWRYEVYKALCEYSIEDSSI
jgi:hypothetical protein